MIWQGTGRAGPDVSLMISRLLALILVGAALAGCATNQATGKTQLVPLMSRAEEARVGAENHPKIIQAYGGVYDDPAVGRYVADVTDRVVKGYGPQGAGQYRVTVLDSPIVNAFALPGGYVYVTRGLLALANDEAELAGVIGHEVGHVLARHSAQRQTAALGTSLLGAVLGAVVGNNAVNQIVGMGGQGLLASYSRDQEYEADELGVRALAGAGYDPLAEADFLASLGAQDTLNAAVSNQKDAGGQISWLSSHPATPDRVQAARAHARASGVAAGSGVRNQTAYFKAINGLLYGDSLSQGVIRDRTFLHPVSRFKFTAPSGYEIVNSAKAVVVQGPDKTQIKFDADRKQGGRDIADYLVNEWAKGVQLTSPQRLTIHGMAAATAMTRINGYNARLVAIQYDDTNVYRFLIGTLPQIGGRRDAELIAMVNSFQKLSAAQARAIKPLRVRIVTVRSGDTAAKLGLRMVWSDHQALRFRVLNGLALNAEPRVGSQVKLVTE
ncbi:MAG: M48 family metalloprotease [Rhizobiales bacterium]|nr:M48 family metalloprotease [Hyphomicrobiales bacterium]